ncbi:MAG TPA: hypothetical protein VF708_01500 [Pyrinomonadaceae bacterium]
MYILQTDEPGAELYRRIYLLIRKDRWTHQSIGASIGIAGGLGSIIIGAILWLIVSLLAPGSPGSFLNTVEIILFVLSLPLLTLGAYCLDLLEKNLSRLPSPIQSQPGGFEHLMRLRPQQTNKN